MSRRATLSFIIMLCATAAQAQSFRAENRVIVNPLPAGQFEVIEGGEHGARSVWCAAADYAQDRLGAQGTSRLFVTVPRGDAQTAPGRKGIGFGLKPQDGPGSILILRQSIRTQGASLSVGHADQFCNDRFLNAG